MRYLLIYLFVLPSVVHAEQPSCPLAANIGQQATAEASGLLCHRGSIGQWFPLVTARKLLIDLKAGKIALGIQADMERRIRLTDKTELLYIAQIDASNRIAKTWEKQSLSLLRAGSRCDNWYKSPALWFAAGVLATAATGFTTIKLYNEIR